MEELIAFDEFLFGLINGLWQHPILDYLLPIWRTKTTWIPLYILLLIVIYKRHGKRTIFFLIIIGITILVADQISSELLKKTVERLRPCREPSLSNVRTLVHCGGGYSFTSSHATNHFALVMQLFLLFRLEWSKAYYWGLFLWASLIAYAQVYVGVHYPLDVLVGAILGVVIAYFIFSIMPIITPKKFYNKKSFTSK